MSRVLKVTLLREGKPFRAGEFEVKDTDYATTMQHLAAFEMNRVKAEGWLSSFILARELSHLTEDMYKLAMVSSVWFLSEGIEEVEIPLSQDPAAKKGDA